MKIGFSLGKCVRDIVNGTVNIDDVIVIVTRTRLVKDEHFEQLRWSYGSERDYWLGLDVDECMRVSLELFHEGKLHQPRLAGAVFYSPVTNDFVWMDLAPTANSDNAMVQAAWAKYQMVAKLSSTAPKLTVEDAAAAVAPSDHSSRETPMAPVHVNAVEVDGTPLNDDF
jgi:hypothetical protein